MLIYQSNFDDLKLWKISKVIMVHDKVTRNLQGNFNKMSLKGTEPAIRILY